VREIVGPVVFKRLCLIFGNITVSFPDRKKLAELRRLASLTETNLDIFDDELANQRLKLLHLEEKLER
jgi:hypothetical protein